jgi:glucan 1,3-beta-glucosidase
LFDDDTYQEKTISILVDLTGRLATVTNVVGIELINEPSNVENLVQFCESAWPVAAQLTPDLNALDAIRNSSSEAAAFPL